MTQKSEIQKKLRKNSWVIILLVLSSTGITLGIYGFTQQGCVFSECLYRTFQLFFLNISFDEFGTEVPKQLQLARWLIFASFIWATFRLFFEILAPQFFQNLKIRYCYRNHIIICGLNDFTNNLVEKFKDRQIIVLSEEKNSYTKFLETKDIILLIGDFSDKYFWNKAKLGNANMLYAITDNDEKNVKITQSAFSVLANKNKQDALKCFVLINDRKLKNVLEDANLFNKESVFLDSTLFNINEMGIKYGIAMNIDKILPSKIEAPPEILLIGLTELTEIALINLVQCLTMEQENFKFTIVEQDQDKILQFKKKNTFLFNGNFAYINFIDNFDQDKLYDSILICLDDPIEAIKNADKIRYNLGKDNKDKYIITFNNKTDALYEVLIDGWRERKIIVMNLINEITDYVFNLDADIEEMAKEAHYYWNNLYNMNKEWNELTGHFKQSNRNQILDNYLRIYIARGKKIDDFKKSFVSFSENEKIALAIMEHRRWMLEKYDNAWSSGEKDVKMKRHNCLCPWEKLPQEQQTKDFDAINLMIKLLNNQKNESVYS